MHVCSLLPLDTPIPWCSFPECGLVLFAICIQNLKEPLPLSSPNFSHTSFRGKDLWLLSCHVSAPFSSSWLRCWKINTRGSSTRRALQAWLHSDSPLWSWTAQALWQIPHHLVFPQLCRDIGLLRQGELATALSINRACESALWTSASRVPMIRCRRLTRGGHRWAIRFAPPGSF